MRGPAPPHQVPCTSCGAPINCRCLGVDHRRECEACDLARRAPQDILGTPIIPGAAVVFALAETQRRGLSRGLVLATEPAPRDRRNQRPRFRVYVRAMYGVVGERHLTVRVGDARRVLVVPNTLTDAERELLGRHQFRRRPRRRSTLAGHETWLRKLLDGLGSGQ